MAKIVFIQRLWYEFPGTEILSACLKKGGHDTDILIDDYPDATHPVFEGASIIAFSIMTGSQDWALSTSRRLKAATGALIVFGGPHPTHSPDIIHEAGVDVVCRGEGDAAIVDLADRVGDPEAITGILNLWVKHNGKVFCNDVRPLIADLDSLPPPDRDIYYLRYPMLAKNPHKPFLAGRGCPYSCSFCSNEALRALYKDKGPYTRLRSPENLLDEIRQVQASSRLTKIFFHDDTFVLNHSWLFRFLELYERHVKLPFYCQSRADTLTDALAAKLKQAGCQCVFYAVESGVESLRRGILCKELGDAAIIESAKLLRKHKIKISTYNLIGIPGETVEDALQTIRMNIAIRADYPRCSFLTPYPGTRIAEAAQARGYVYNKATIEALSQQSGLLLSVSTKREFENIHALFQTAVLMPFTFPLVKKLVYLRLNPLYRAWWLVTYFVILLRSEGRSILSALPFLPVIIRQRIVGFSRRF